MGRGMMGAHSPAPCSMTSSSLARTARSLTLMLTAALVVSACSENTLTSASASADALSPTSAAAKNKERPAPIEGQYIVVFDESVLDVPAVAKRLARDNGGELFATYQKALKGFAVKGLSANAIERLKASPFVKYVEQDQVITKAATQQNPPAWGLDRVDARSGLDNAYTFNATGAGVSVYVIDTGIDPAHPDFSGRATAAFDVFNDGQNGVDCDGHGTHVAGTVGSETYGVAKDASLFGVRVLGCDANGNGGGTNAGVIEGIDWVAANAQKPASANMSLGGGFSQAVNDAVENLVASGVPTAVAAGNGFFGIFSEDACTKSPASAPSALTVSITDQSDAKVSWGNFGSCVDLFAPGAGILSTVPGGGTASFSGTSMSSPHVAGALALYLEGNPNATSAQANQAILDATTTGAVSNREGTVDRLLYTLDFTAGGGGGGGEPPANNAPTAAFSQSCAGLTCDFTDTSSDSDGTIASRSWDFGDGGSSSAANPSHTYGSAGTYTVTLTVTDDDGASATTSKQVTVQAASARTITLTASARTQRNRGYTDLSWNGDGGDVRVVRNGSTRSTTADDGAYTDNVGKKPSGSYSYQVCETNSSVCSNTVTVRF